MKQVHLLISGLVQGVGYRNFVRYEAKKLGLVGWVRNITDKRVEVIACGQENSLRELIKRCESGPLLSDVKNVSVEWQDSNEAFDNFEKRPTV